MQDPDSFSRRVTISQTKRVEGMRRSGRLSQSSAASGSQYQASEHSDEQPMKAEEPEEEEPATFARSKRGRTVKQATYVESDEDEDDFAAPRRPSRFAPRAPSEGRRQTRSSRNLPEFIDDEEDDDPDAGWGARPKRARIAKVNSPSRRSTRNPQPSKAELSIRARATRAAKRARDEDYVDGASSPDIDASFDPEPEEDDLAIDMNDEGNAGEDEQKNNDGKPYAFRQRSQINYALPPPLEEIARAQKKARSRKTKNNHLPWSTSGAELGKIMGAGDDSDSDNVGRTPGKAYRARFAAAQPLGDTGLAGTPSNLGKVTESTLADSDPLGVNVNVTFDSVGGLDDHINSLKEMTLLPLLYPEVFQQFNITPPRGVLFHGPPGTGKTLLARALAASCRSDGKQITFFMRKGADALSKWVGEAERQLRLLFEEAKACQPSIIFFDEIDGLAPVRSSKQEQIHASIVSTLLALMDGMDGRGQVIVIGATNRPDSIDPALRRPGRFDREFYFPLPNLEARKKILGIMLKGWDGWSQPEDDERVAGLAKLTKGYGGADLRALTTEAALNAVQRRYPQIYKSQQRLLLQPETIRAGLRDFMIAIKKMVPSSARSTASAAEPLPIQFLPLLSPFLDNVKDMVGKILPMDKKRTALEEAEFEDYQGEEGALERELTMQSMEKLRIYRPRLVIHGPPGMGQAYVGAALLHHLEGYHVQSLELGTLISDPTRTVESSLVQLFIEAKRHQPAVIYIPSLVGWCSVIPAISRATFRAMLDTLSPTDPILLLAVVDGDFRDLPQDVRAWFGLSKENRVAIPLPSESQRVQFFEGLLTDILRPPNQFADGVVRRKRVLEVLPIAPPIAPKQLTEAELAAQAAKDQQILNILIFRLAPIIAEIKRKHKRFCKSIAEEYSNWYALPPPPPPPPASVNVPIQPQVNGVHPNDGQDAAIEELHNQAPHVNGDGDVTMNAVVDVEQAPPPPQLFDIDLEKIHRNMYRCKYLCAQDVMEDIEKIVHNARTRAYEDEDRLMRAQAMFNAMQVAIDSIEPHTLTEWDRMAVRERARRAVERAEREKSKSKEKEVPHTPPGGLRRSGRNTGQEPEIPITDPAKLERRLKRNRAGGEAGGSDKSSEENEVDDGRESKRSRLSAEQDDELNLRETHGTAVHFHPVVEPMLPLDNYQIPPLGAVPYPENTVQSMPVDSPMVGLEVAEALPLQADPDNAFVVGSSSSYVQVMPPHSSVPSTLASLLNPNESDPPYSNSSFIPAVQKAPSRTATPVPERDASPTPVPVAVIERSPTPPLPDFRVSETLLDQLRTSIRTSTQSLTIEQLEQLRATCVACVWRHRASWDRDNLVHELCDMISDFVQEASEYNAEDMSPDVDI